MYCIYQPMRPHILIEEKIPFIKGRLEAFADIEYVSGKEFTPQRVKDADALLVRTRDRCDASLLKGSRISLIATGTIGMDHIDTTWCNSAGIKTVNSPGCNAPGVAQYVFSSLIAMHGNLSGARIAVVGCGNVGSIVAEWSVALGLEPLVCDTPREKELRESLPYRFMSLEEALKRCDIVTLHTPLIKSGSHATYHLIDRHIVSMLRGKTLVNAARGAVTDTEALLEAHHRGETRLAIDCWEGEPALSYELLTVSEIASPHIAGYSAEGKQRATRMITEAVGKHFGFTPYVSDLAGDYVPLSHRQPGKFSPERIRDSFDPWYYTELLKMHPENFEKFREELPYRHEV